MKKIYASAKRHRPMVFAGSPLEVSPRVINIGGIGGVGGPIFNIFFVFLNIDGPIVPGQPITFSWSYNMPPTNKYPDFGDITASLYLVNSDGSINLVEPLWSTIVLAATSNNLNSPQFIFTPPQGVANAIYQINSNPSLQLVITGKGITDGALYSIISSLSVVPETVGPDWWQWTGDCAVPGGPSVQWKNDHYAIQGNLVNQSQHADMVCNATLYESGDVSKTYISTGGTLTIPKTQTVPIPFNYDFAKSWQWIQTGLWYIKDVLSKSWSYSVEMELEDQFGNVYRPALSTSISVYVEVSGVKQAAGGTAYTAALTAAGLAVAAAATVCVPPVAAALAGAAATAYAIASAAGAIANDPPTPDPRYAHPVKLLKWTVSDKLHHEKFTRPIAAMLEEVGAVVSKLDGLDRIASRILGAKKAGDKEAEKMQVAAAALLRNQLVQESRQIQRLGRLLSRSIMTHPRYNQEVAKATIAKWVNDKRTAESITEILTNAGCSANCCEKLNQLVRLPSIAETVSDLSGLVKALAFHSAQLAKLASKID